MGRREPGELIGRNYWEVAAEHVPDPSWVQRGLQAGVAVRGGIARRWPIGRTLYPSPAA